jgi:hypothetical protein
MTDFGSMFEGTDPLEAILAAAHLTMESSGTSYGAPVLQIGTQTYGPADLVPGTSQSTYPGSSMTASAIVAKQAVLRCRSISDDELALITQFLALYPDGPQVYRADDGEVRVR